MDRDIKCRFKVNRDTCLAIVACIVAAEDIYEMDDEAKAIIKKLDLEDIQENMREEDHGWVTVECTQGGYDRIVESAHVCPLRAIIVEKWDEKAQEWEHIYGE